MCLITQSCPTLCNPMDCSPLGSSVHGVFQMQEYWSELPFPSPGDRLTQGLKSCLCLLHWQAGSLPLSHLESPEVNRHTFQFSSVTQSCPTLCNPTDCSMPGFLSITNSQSFLKLMSIELVMPSKHLILCCPLLLLPSVFPSIRVFSSESVLPIRWPKDWDFSFSISPINIQD